MVVDMNYWMKVIRKILAFALSIIGIYMAFKFAIFYMPFLIAFIISLIMEPIIKFLMKKFKIKRKVSSVIVLIVVLSIIIGILSIGIVRLITESYNLLNSLNGYFTSISNLVTKIINKIDLSKLNLPNEIVDSLKNSAFGILNTLTENVKGILIKIIELITSIPTMIIYLVITLLSLYFICSDKIYMVDQLEHHLPRTWVKKLTKFIKEISNSIGSFLKAQIMLILVSFMICLIGLTVFNIVGLNVTFPLLSALGVAFVDALPIFGSATVMMPWAIISSINGDVTLSIALLILLGIMAFTRQILEPKIVSGQLGIHPIFTLISMYTGFRIIGVIGLFIGPIILIILKNIFSTMIDKGLAKSIFDRE